MVTTGGDMGIIIYQVDAFTDVPFFGNPAAVCVLDEPVEDGWIHTKGAH
jgi:predicted PhzF superfamily epimerase YddE/YHI9